MSGAVFIGYRRSDAGGHAGRLFDQLKSRFGDDSVFLDIDSIDAGADFRDRINEAIDRSAVLIAVVGPGWLTPKVGREAERESEGEVDHVLVELETALAKRVSIVPVLVGGASMPKAADLPVSIREIASFNAHTLADVNWIRDVDVLARALQLQHGVSTARFDRLRDGALLLAAIAVALSLVSIQDVPVPRAEIVHYVVDILVVAALVGFMAAIGWLARFVGGSRLVGLSALSGLAVFLRALDAEALALSMVIAAVLLFKDISVVDNKTARRLVDRFDFLLEGGVIGAAIGVVICPVVFQLARQPEDPLAGLGTGLVIGSLLGAIAGVRLKQVRETRKSAGGRANRAS